MYTKSMSIFDAENITRPDIALGTEFFMPNGNVAVFCKAAGAIPAGHLAFGAVAVANHINLNVAAAAAGAREVTVTLGATACAANKYAGGYLTGNDGTAEGFQIEIVSHPAANASAAMKVYLKDPLPKALVGSGSSQVSLYPHICSAVFESATEENVPVGIPIVDVADGEYFFAIRKGYVNALISGSPAVGSILVPGAVAGSVAAMSGTFAVTIPIIGKMAYTAGVDTEYKLIKIEL